MRRGFSISLVLLFLLAPLMTWLPGVDESSLPACCRRHGSHHCAASSDLPEGAGGATHFTAPSRCPRFNPSGPATLAAFLLPAGPPVMTPLRQPAPAAPDSQARRAQLRTASDRGPPAAC
ncbi:hypothetical protein DYQ86_02260 [Acidobacteria bacterium AB60]|nr:hypothetical protein DYQ86_02260 [Acidobacteria bacterium AB60]